MSEHAALELPERRLFWHWVWDAVRPVLGWALAAVGAIMLLVGWFGVSGQALTAKQLPYLVSAGLGGIAVVIIAAVFLATDDVRRSLARLDSLERKVDDLHQLFAAYLEPAVPAVLPAPVVTSATDHQSNGHHPPGSGAGASRLPAKPGATLTETLVALRTGRTYHRSSCVLVAGKDAVEVTPDEVARRGLKPCRLCTPA